MESTLYTIESDTGVYLSAHPSFPERTVAWLYHDPASAALAIEHAQDPSAWRVVTVVDLETWLDSLLADDTTHVIEHLTPMYSTERSTAGWLLMLRAKQAGREYVSKKREI